MTQRISRGDNCVICVEICETSRETWSLIVIDDLPEMIGWMKEQKEKGVGIILFLVLITDFALRQSFLQCNNLSLSEVWIALEIQRL